MRVRQNDSAKTVGIASKIAWVSMASKVALVSIASKIALVLMASKMAASKMAALKMAPSKMAPSKMAASKIALLSHGLLPYCFSLLSSCHSALMSEKLARPRFVWFRWVHVRTNCILTFQIFHDATSKHL